MLYPQMTATRTLMSLDGLWKFAADAANEGEQQGWPSKLQADREMAVPASWNEQYQDLMYFFGIGWYERTADLPVALQSERVWLRVGAANYLSTVWVNGQEVGFPRGRPSAVCDGNYGCCPIRGNQPDYDSRRCPHCRRSASATRCGARAGDRFQRAISEQLL